jgi:hypothetical protein
MLRLDELWAAIQTRVNSRRMQEILGGRERVYRPTDDVKEIEAEPSEPWGRIIMLPASTLWPQTDEPGAWQNVAWLMSVQFNDFRASGYNVDIAVAAAHEEAFQRLDNFVPAPQPERVVVVVPVWREGSPPSSAVYDRERRLWMSNAQYRTQVIPR